MIIGGCMKTFVGPVSWALFAMSASGVALAQETPGKDATDYKGALDSCLQTAVDDADRRSLVQWIFVMMANHPDVAAIARIDAGDADRISHEGAKLFERLIAEDCAGPMRTAVQRGGSDAIGGSFKILGETAMTGLTEDPKVNAAIEKSMGQIDKEKLIKAMVQP